MYDDITRIFLVVEIYGSVVNRAHFSPFLKNRLCGNLLNINKILTKLILRPTLMIFYRSFINIKYVDVTLY